MRRKALQCRNRSGVSITELLITTVLLGVTMAVIGELAVLTTMGSVKITNKADGLAAARVAMNRIATDIRHARAVGDFYGEGQSRLRFPASTNPIYGATMPAAGWPVAPWNPNMTLSDAVLVLQIPVTYEDPTNEDNPANGFPIMLPKGHFGGNNPPCNMENLDTVVYQVVADPDRAGEYQLQVAKFSGEQILSLPSKSNPSINPPQIILKGLVGPRAVAGGEVPAVFSYFARNLKSDPNSPSSLAPSAFFKVTPTSSNIETIGGIGVDLEIKNTGLKAEQGDGRFPQYFGIHTEAYMRSNKAMILNNTTEPPP